MAESAISTRQVVMLAAAIAGLTLVMLSTRRRFRESKALSSNSPVRDRYARTAQQQRATRDLDQVMLQLDQLSRQVHGRLDTKLAMLETVIRDADQRIEELSQLVRASIARPPHEEPGFSEHTRNQAEGHPKQDDQRYGAVYQLADRGQSLVDIAGKTGKTIGEIELILALRKTKRQSQGTSSVPVTAEPA